MNRRPTLFLYIYVLLCLFSLPGPAAAQEKTPRELFTEAYALFSQNHPAEAESLFAKSLNRGSPLEDYSLYYLGEILLSRGDADGAGKYFGQVKQQFPQSVWAPRADLQIAKIMLAAKNVAGAREGLNEIQNKTPTREIADEARFLLGRTYELEREPKLAHSLFQELRRASPLSPWAAKAREAVLRLRKEHPQQFELTTAEALADEAELLLNERQFEAAEKLYRKALQLTPREGPRPRLLRRLAQVYLDSRRRDEAIPLLGEIARDYGGSPEAPEALYYLARIYWNRDENLKALEVFGQLQDRYPQNNFSDFAHFSSARIQESLGKTEEAQRLYQDFTKKYPRSPLLDEATWRLAWLLYLKADHAEAYAVFKRLAEARRGTRYRTAALYWQGRTAERMGRTEDAKQSFLKILSVAEDSYYKGPAAKRLDKLGVAHPESPSPPPSGDSGAVPTLGPAGQFHLSRARELAEISLHQLAVRELDEIRNRGVEDATLKLFLAREYARNRDYARSIAIANQIADSPGALSRYRYPLAYWESIRKVSDSAGLDPYLVLALIRQESLFDPKALSPASAHGLMQLLPSTASRVAQRLSLGGLRAESLFEPELNLKIGTSYLKELLQRYGENLIKAIAAYNAGEQAVARWEKQIPTEDEEEFIERIPYGETRLYVQLVLRNHRTYRKIYDSRR